MLCSDHSWSHCYGIGWLSSVQSGTSFPPKFHCLDVLWKTMVSTERVGRRRELISRVAGPAWAYRFHAIWGSKFGRRRD